MAKKMSLSNLFFKTVEVDDEPQVVQQPIQPSTPSMVPQEDKEIKEQLLKALEVANTPGYDYFEFAKAVEAQAAFIPTEAIRFQSAFAAAAVMDVTINTLITSAQHYLQILANKEKEFLTALNSHTSTSVTAKESEATSIDTSIAEKAELIKKLTTEMNEIQQRKTQLLNEAASGKAEVEKIKNNFYATLNVVTSKINTDIDKIKTYISQGGK